MSGHAVPSEVRPGISVNREHAVALDLADPLSHFQERYLPHPDDVLAYLDGNSLGRPLTAIVQRWESFGREQWAGRLIRGWSEGWMELPEIVGDELAAAALGAAPGQTVIADSTTVNFYKSMRAAINLRPGRRRVVVDRDNFPTNRYVVESLARDLQLELVWLQAEPGTGITAEDVAAVVYYTAPPRVGGTVQLVRWLMGDTGWDYELVTGHYLGISDGAWQMEMGARVESYPRAEWQVCQRD